MVSIEHLETPAFLIDVLADNSFAYRYGNEPLFTRTALGQHLVIGRTPEDLLPSPLASVVIAQYRDCVATRAVMSFEEQFRLAGTTSHWRTTLVPIQRPESGAVAQILGLVVEITDSKRAELDVYRANAQLSLALQAVQGTHWEYDIGSNHFTAAPSLALLLGEAEPRAVSLDEWVRMIPLADRPCASFHTLVDGSTEEQITRFRIETAQGEERWLKCRRLAVKGSGCHAQMIFGVTVDITDEVLREQRLTREAQHDGLTPLLNRRGFLERLDRLVAESEPDSVAFDVVMLDLDRFKRINDTLGHAAGDAVLAAVGQRIETMLGPDDFAARLGGDEFVIALRQVGETVPLVTRLRRRLSRPCAFREALIPVAVSVGTARWTPGQASLDVIEAADRSLYCEKRQAQAGAATALANLLRTA